MSVPTPNPWVAIFGALLSGGTAKYVFDFWQSIRSGPSKPLKAQRTVDASIATVARARDELEEDNARLRVQMAEQETRHGEERDRWLTDQNRLRGDIERLEKQIVRERYQAAARYDALLTQVQELRLHGAQSQQEEQR